MNTLQEKSYEEMTLIEMAQTHIDRCQYDLAGLMLRMAQVQAAERQAAALERIAETLANTAGNYPLERMADSLNSVDDAVNKIAAVLERADNLSKMFEG